MLVFTRKWLERDVEMLQRRFSANVGTPILDGVPVTDADAARLEDTSVAEAHGICAWMILAQWERELTARGF